MKLSETEYLSARNNTLELVTFIKFHPSSLAGEVGEGSTRRRVAHQKMNLLLRLESFRPLRQKVSKLEGAAISYFNPVPREGGYQNLLYLPKPNELLCKWKMFLGGTWPFIMSFVEQMETFAFRVLLGETNRNGSSGEEKGFEKSNRLSAKLAHMLETRCCFGE